MDTEMAQLQELLNCLTQPAYCIQDGLVVYRNAAASAEIAVGEEARKYRKETDAVLPLGKSEIVLPEQTEERLQQANVLFFAAQAMRAPLSSLFATASNLFPRLEELEDPTLQKNMAAVNRSFYQLLRLSCNLTDLRAALSGEMKPQLQKTEMTDFIGELCDRTAPPLRLCGLRLLCDIRSRIFYADIDRQMIERAILNLISNAAKYSAPGSTVTVLLEKSGSHAIIKVIDNGEGLASETLSTVYSRFARPLELDDPRWGFGAGLTLVRHIVQLHDGNLLLQASPEGGTTACMMLSLHPQQDRDTVVRSPIRKPDYTGGFSHELTELSDVLPAVAFETFDIN